MHLCQLLCYVGTKHIGEHVLLYSQMFFAIYLGGTYVSCYVMLDRSTWENMFFQQQLSPARPHSHPNKCTVPILAGGGKAGVREEHTRYHEVAAGATGKAEERLRESDDALQHREPRQGPAKQGINRFIIYFVCRGMFDTPCDDKLGFLDDLDLGLGLTADSCCVRQRDGKDGACGFKLSIPEHVNCTILSVQGL